MKVGRRGNLTLRREDGRIVCETVEVADTILRRMRGLLGRGSLEPGEGLLLRPAWSIHTMFMRFPIDVVFVDHDLIVIRIAHSLRPFKTASCRGGREVVELAAGECERRGLEVGDRVAWASRNEPEDGVSSENALPQPGTRGTVAIASGDPRFVKLARFLLDGRGFLVEDHVPAADIPGALADDVDAVLLDAGDALGEGLRSVNTIRAERPDVAVVVVGEGAAARSPEGLRVFDKWDEMDEAMDALGAALDPR